MIRSPDFLVGSSNRREDIRRRSIVAESFADVRESIHVAWRKDKTAAKLKGIFPQTMLAMSPGLRAFACSCVILAQKMEQGSVAQLDGLIGFALLVDQQWEIDLSVLAVVTGVLDIAKSDGD